VRGIIKSGITLLLSAQVFTACAFAGNKTTKLHSDELLCVSSDSFLSLKEISDLYKAEGRKENIKLAGPTIARARKMGLFDEAWSPRGSSYCWEQSVVINISDPSRVHAIADYLAASGLSGEVRFTEDKDKANLFISGFGSRGSKSRDGYCILSAGCLSHFSVRGRTFKDGKVIGQRGLTFFRLGFAFLHKSPFFISVDPRVFYKNFRVYKTTEYPLELDIGLVIVSEQKIEAAECYYNADLEEKYQIEAILNCLKITLST